MFFLLQATSMLQNPGAPPSGGVMNPQSDAPYYSCSVNLPPKQPVLPKDTPMTKQVFFVLQWGQIPGAMLTDLFCRFGNLIEAYLVSGEGQILSAYSPARHRLQDRPFS